MTEATADDENNDKTFDGGEDGASGFQRALIHRQDADSVGAQQYSFFGGFDDGADAPSGGLEEGVDAPPEEERLGGALEEAEEVDLSELDPDLAGDADLSFATMFARSLEDPERAETPFVSSLDTELGGPNTPLGGGSGPVGGGSNTADSLNGLVGALPGLSASAGRSAAAAASSAFGTGFSGGLPPPASGLLDDPWGQLTGLALPVPALQSAPKQQADQQPAAALAGSGAFDAAVPPPQLGQASLNERLDPQPPLQHLPPPPPLQQPQQQQPQQQQQAQRLQQAQAQLAAVRITTPMTVQQLEEQMRAQGQGATAAPPPAPMPQQWGPPPQHPSPSFPQQQPQQLTPQQAAAAAAQRAAAAVYAAQRPMSQPTGNMMLPRPPPGMPPPGMPPGMPPGGPRSYAAMLGGQQMQQPRPPPPNWRPPPGFVPGMHMRPGMGPPIQGPRPPPGWPGMPRPPPGMPPLGPLPPGWPHPPPHGAPPHGMQPGSGMPPGRPHHMPPPQHQGARPRFRSKYMDADEIDSILRIQWRSLHNGPSYVEDFYYQAFLNKHFKGCNARWFAPERIRELAPSERGERGAATFVSLEGLGRIPFSNIRRPKPLMDVGASPAEQTAEDGEDGSRNNGSRQARRPLEQEPAMAARIMIEDCLALLLDVQDVDRLFAASPSGSPEGEVPLRRRRALLMDGLSASLRLAPPEAVTAAGAQDSAAGGGGGGGGGRKGGRGRKGVPDDGVLRRLLGLRKGRDLLARALALMCPPQGAHTEPGGRAVKVQSMALLFGLLRNLRVVFALPPAPDQEDLSLGLRVASAAVGVIRRIDSPLAIASALAAAAGGDLAPASATTAAEDAGDGDAQPLSPNPDSLLPLYPPDTKAGEGQGLWPAELLAALLVRAAEVEPAAAPQPAPEAWDTAWAAFFPLLARHLEMLQMVHAMAKERGLGPAAELAQGMVPIPLIRAALLHASQPQQERIRALLAQLA